MNKKNCPVALTNANNITSTTKFIIKHYADKLATNPVIVCFIRKQMNYQLNIINIFV